MFDLPKQTRSVDLKNCCVIFLSFIIHLAFVLLFVSFLLISFAWLIVL